MKADRLFQAIAGSDLGYRGVRLSIHSMEYPFYWHSMFGVDSRKEKDLEDFTRIVSDFVFKYISNWMVEYKDDSAKTLRALYDFQSVTDFKKVFESVYADADYLQHGILIPVSNAQLCMKRYGDGLALKLLANNTTSQEVHVNGTKILQAWFDDVEGLGRYLNEFIHSVECVISVPNIQGEGNSVRIDFSDVHHKLTTACPYVEWSSTSDFVEAITGFVYTNPSDYKPGIRVGRSQKCGLNIVAELVHTDQRDSEKNRQWRSGNISDLGNYQYEFVSGRDLCLSLRVECPFRQSPPFEKESFSGKLHDVQDDVLKTGATLYAQLCSMQSNAYPSA
jgi:hypothetical protein